MTKQDIIKSIYKAFKDVCLEGGIGLYEANCLDDYMSPADPAYISWKQRDEKENWDKLLPLFLSEGISERVHTSNWYFMDGKGKRFHLPCFMLLDIENKLKDENPIVISLTYEPVDLSFLDVLNTLQKQIILNFLEYKTEEFFKANNDFDYENYSKAKEVLENYFTENGI